MVDKLFYKLAADEVASGNFDEALWIKTCADMPGIDLPTRQAKYIQLRAQEMANDKIKQKAVVIAQQAKAGLAPLLKVALVIGTILAVGLVGVVLIIAITDKRENITSPQVAEPVKAPQTATPRPMDTKGWQAYLSQIVQQHMQGIQNNPYVYFVPPGDSPDNQAERGRVQDLLNGVVAATVLPGNMIVAGGPDSGKTADALIAAFKNAQLGSFKGVVVLFIGEAADQQRVQAAVAPSGADFRFAQM